MRVLLKRKALSGILKWTQRFFFACAVLLLGYCGFVVGDAWVFQQRESRNLQRLLGDHHKASGEAPQFRPVISTGSPANPAR